MRLSIPLFLAFVSELTSASFVGSKKTVTERATSKIHIFNSIDGVISVGDTLPFSNRLHDAENVKEVGEVHGVCTYLDVTDLSWSCSYTMIFPDGNIMVMGNLSSQQQCSEQVIVGGTGAYNHAEGTDTLCWPLTEEMNYAHNIELVTARSPSTSLSAKERELGRIPFKAFGTSFTGDTYPFSKDIFDEGGENKLGRVDGVCTYVKTNPNIWQCYSTYAFPDGKIAGVGELYKGEDCTPQAIAGGSGKYLGAQGTINLCWLNDWSNDSSFIFQMAEPLDRPMGKRFLVERLESNAIKFNSDLNVVSVGDTLTFANELYDESNTVLLGNIYGTCTYLATDPKEWMCEQTYQFSDGKIMTSGLLMQDEKCANFNIVGGTGAAVGAAGIVERCWAEYGNGQTQEHIVMFDKPPVPLAASSGSVLLSGKYFVAASCAFLGVFSLMQ